MKEKNLMMLPIFIITLSLFTGIPITAQINEPQELTKDDNVTSTIKPQGTSIGVQNETSMSEDNSQTTSAGNVTSTIKPQGTSIDNTN
ncbi:MAG TPA: hypothetical protein VIZ62_12210 [Nitrososphaeraceae archaeon]|jgi:hypothetical protein